MAENKKENPEVLAEEKLDAVTGGEYFKSPFPAPAPTPSMLNRCPKGLETRTATAACEGCLMMNRNKAILPDGRVEWSYSCSCPPPPSFKMP
jgi:hypothetical protein